MFKRKQTPPYLVLANQIPGWMTYEELTWLAQQARKHRRIVEIGTYMGRSARAMGDNTDGFVVTIDDFKGPRDITLPQLMRENIFDTFVWEMGDLLVNKKVIVVTADHKDVNLDFSPDMVFLDGSHEYQDVKRDIALWLPRITPGGLICGHDYTNMVTVRDAVAELVPKAKVAKDTSIWYAQV